MSNLQEELWDIEDRINRLINMDFKEDDKRIQYINLLSELEEVESDLDILQKTILEEEIKYYKKRLVVEIEV